jgi:serine/threonine protein kinase
MDQINRIHRLCGKPSKELIARFQKNPNPSIPLEFSANANRDLKELLPHVSEPTMDLLKGLLAYDATRRLTAKEALDHPALDLFKAYDEMWHKHGCIGSFSAFCLTYPPPPLPPQGPPMAEAVEAHHRLFQDKSEKAFQIPPELMQPQPLPEPSTMNVNVHQARREAAKRVRDYQQSIKPKKAADAPGQKSGLRFEAPTILKRVIRVNAKSQIVQPTLRRVPIPTFA